MSTETQELIRVCESLPEEKRAEVADLAVPPAGQDDVRWEELIASGQQRPKLDAFLRQSATDFPTPMELGRL